MGVLGNGGVIGYWGGVIGYWGGVIGYWGGSCPLSIISLILNNLYGFYYIYFVNF